MYINLNDGKLALLRGGDAVPFEPKYQVFCLTTQYDRERGHRFCNREQRKLKFSQEMEIFLWFSLGCFITETRYNNGEPVVYGHAILVSPCIQRLQQFS